MSGVTSHPDSVLEGFGVERSDGKEDFLKPKCPSGFGPNCISEFYSFLFSWFGARPGDPQGLPRPLLHGGAPPGGAQRPRWTRGLNWARRVQGCSPRVSAPFWRSGGSGFGAWGAQDWLLAVSRGQAG